MIEKYGAKYYIQSDKCKQEMMDKYGADYYVQSEHCKKVMMDKYGAEYYIQSKNCRQEMMDKYGHEWFIQSERYKQIMMEKYGAESPMQCPELFRRAQQASFRRRAYVSPDGETFMVLGYEDAALDDLLYNQGIQVVYAGEDPRIPVYTYYDEDGKAHKYYPEIYIPEENRVIDVKSMYVYNRDPERTLWKALSVSEDALFELRLYDDRREMVEVLEYRNGILYSHTHGRLEMGVRYTPLSRTAYKFNLQSV
jgi:hypothetical protein